MMTNNLASNDVQPGDIFFVDPFTVEVGPDKQHMPPKEEVWEMVVSMHKHGQRRPVECRRIGPNRFLLLHGLIRTAAAQMLRQGFTCLDPETKKPIKIRDRRFLLKVVFPEDSMECGEQVTVAQNAEMVPRQAPQEKLRCDEEQGCSSAD